MFPKSDIKITEDAHTFLRQVKSLIDENGNFETHLTLEPPSECFSSNLSFAPRDRGIQEDLVGIFVSWSNEYPLIELQTIARWEPTFPSYETVRETAESLFLPVIRSYNRKHGTRYHFRIDSAQAARPKLTPKAKKAFDEFAYLANRRALHPLDWERFYTFVRVCRATRNDLYESDVAYFLRKAGFSGPLADHISQVYLHCRAFHISSDSRREMSYRLSKKPKNKASG